MATKMVENSSLKSSNIISDVATNEVRKLADKIDNRLQNIDVNLCILRKYTTELNAGCTSMYTARNYLCKAFNKLFSISKESFLSHYDQNLLAEPDNFYDALCEIRDLILRCTKLNAEQYLIGKQFYECSDIVNILKTSSGIVPADKSNIEQRSSFPDLYDVVKGISVFIYEVVRMVANKMKRNRFHRRQVFKELFKFRKEFEAYSIKEKLHRLCQQLETTIEDLKTFLNDSPNEYISTSVISIGIKAYKDYIGTFEKTKPENNGKSDKQISIRAYCVKQIVDKCNNVTVGEAWELVNAIRAMVTRE